MLNIQFDANNLFCSTTTISPRIHYGFIQESEGTILSY